MFRPKTPLFLQMEATECGAAALAMVLASHGRWITLEEARERCGTSRDGVTAAGIVEAARSYGLDAQAFRREPADLAELPMPQVLHWCFDHFVVLEKISGERFVILDPAQGRLVFDRAAFDERFTGITIAFAKAPEFRKGGKPPSIAGALASEALRSKDALVVAFFTGILALVPGLALAGALGTLVNHVLGARQTDWVPWLLGALVIVVLLQAAIAGLMAWTIASWKVKIGSVSALAGFAQALRLPLAYYSQRGPGEVVARIRLGSDLGGTVAGPLAQMMPQIMLVVGFLAVVGLYDTTIMQAAIVTAAINFLVLFWILRRLADRTREFQLAEGRASAVGTTGMDNLGAYVQMGREQLLLQRWSAAEDAAIAAEQRLGLLRVLAKLGPAAAGYVLVGVVLVVCTLRAMDGAMTLGDLVALQVLCSLVTRPLAALAEGFCAIQQSAGALMRLADLERHSAVAAFDNRTRAPAPAAVAGHLALEGVDFAHAPGQRLFTNLTLDIPAGRVVAIVGPTGVGKSTLARIAAGMLDPTAGRVTLDGRALPDWPVADLRRHLAYVGQHAATFTGKISENITMFDPSVPDSDVADAARRAGFGEAVARRPSGMETKLASGATGFSGGERQRLALARALVTKPRVLILDEITSALDPTSEEATMAELRASGATVLVVTHRQGTALRCDAVIHVGPDGVVTRGAAESSVDHHAHANAAPQLAGAA